MRNVYAGLFVCMLAMPAGLANAQGFDGTDTRIAREHGWMLNYDEAKALARKTNRPMMIVFRCVP